MAVTEAAIGIPGQSQNLDATQVTTGEGAVLREAVFMADPETANARAAVLATAPTDENYGLVVRPYISDFRGHQPFSPFSELVTTQRTAVIELNSIYGTSALRDITTLAGTGAVSTSTTGEINLATGATASSSALLQSAEWGRYMPGYGAEVGAGIRLPSAPTGEHSVTWGLFEGTEGVYFGKDATSLYVALLRNNVETRVNQANWNGDKLDGTGPSGLTIDLSNGYIFQIQFTWYGYGVISFVVVAPVDNEQRAITCHSVRVNGSTSIQSPNLPISVQIENGATASNFQVYVGGRQYSIIGAYTPIYRITSDFRVALATSTAIIPVVSFRRKSAFKNRSVKIEGYSIGAVTEPLIVQLRLNGSLTGASWGTPANHTAAECAVESDVSATAITGGEVLWEDLVMTAGVGAKSTGEDGRSSLSLDIPTTQPVTLCVRTVSGTGTVNTVFRVEEEW
jgi:hypothetical protein